MEIKIQELIMLFAGAIIGFLGQYLSLRIQNSWNRSQRQLEKLEDLAKLAYEIRNITASGKLTPQELMIQTRDLIAKLGVSIRVHNPKMKREFESLSKDLDTLLITNPWASPGVPNPELLSLVMTISGHTEELLEKIGTESTKLRS